MSLVHVLSKTKKSGLRVDQILIKILVFDQQINPDIRLVINRPPDNSSEGAVTPGPDHSGVPALGHPGPGPWGPVCDVCAVCPGVSGRRGVCWEKVVQLGRVSSKSKKVNTTI